MSWQGKDVYSYLYNNEMWKNVAKEENRAEIHTIDRWHAIYGRGLSVLNFNMHYHGVP